MTTCQADPPCSLCCKTFKIIELDKPRMQWCPHCPTHKGCAIYSTRPQSCQDFQCIWLMSQTDPGQSPMPVELKPSACGGVMHFTKDETKLVIDMNDGKDWRAGPLGTFIEQTSYQVPIFVRIRDRLIFLKDNNILADFSDKRLMTGDRVDLELPE